MHPPGPKGLDAMTDVDRSTAAPAVQMRGICKSFEGDRVLVDVDFDVRHGEVHALVGGNGAGKSTLMKILQGVYDVDAGDILVDGQRVTLRSIDDARKAGIGMVFQEFSLVPTLTVARNIYLTAEPRTRWGLLRDRECVRLAQDVFAEMGVSVDPEAELGTLGTAYWQLTEIAKALAKDAHVLILDEPTASLAKQETEALFELIGRLRSRGMAIIYISHRMNEVYRIADRITVLRDGQRLFTKPLAEVTPAQVVEGVAGHTVDIGGRRTCDSIETAGPPLLEVRHLVAAPRLRDVSFAVHRGEIVGIAGLMGSGRTELARCIFGVDPVDGGEILVSGRRIDPRTSKDAIRAGVALIPEDRREQGLVLDHSVRSNLLLPVLRRIRGRLLLSDRRGREVADQAISRFGIKTRGAGIAVRFLSGGNQQKVVIAKWLGTEPDILVMDEPTAGVDVGTKSEILDSVRRLADEGKGVVLISSEYAELLAVCDRILVLRDGVTEEIADVIGMDEELLQLAVQGVAA